MALCRAWIEFWSCQVCPRFECMTPRSSTLWGSSTTMGLRKDWPSSCQAGRSPCCLGSSVAIMTFGSKFSSPLDLFQSIENWHASGTKSAYFGSWSAFSRRFHQSMAYFYLSSSLFSGSFCLALSWSSRIEMCFTDLLMHHSRRHSSAAWQTHWNAPQRCLFFAQPCCFHSHYISRWTFERSSPLTSIAPSLLNIISLNKTAVSHFPVDATHWFP